MEVSVTVIDRSKELAEAKNEAVIRALEALGQTAERHAAEKCPVDIGTLRQSISHSVAESEQTVYIGTNVEYAPYVEAGTGIYADKGGRKTPWRYQDRKGKWHTTKGQKPRHFLKDAATKHNEEYKQITENILKGA